jgi:plasmid maintenance system antidote protein VapI
MFLKFRKSLVAKLSEFQKRTTSPEFWLNLQRDFDLKTAEIAAGDKIAATIHPRAA